MRDFEVRYVNEFNFVTEWMTDTQEGFEFLRKKVKPIAQDFLDFISKNDETTKGMHIHYYHLDSDTYAEGDDVVNWSVTLRAKSEEGFTEELSGHHPAIKYRVVDVKTNDVILESDFDSCLEYIENKFPQYDVTTQAGADEITKYMFIETYEEDYLSLD